MEIPAAPRVEDANAGSNLNDEINTDVAMPPPGLPELPLNMRGKKLVDAIVWAPPQTEPEVVGWERIRVLKYVSSREFEYDVEYLESDLAKHACGVRDEWQGDDFNGCFIQEDDTHCATPPRDVLPISATPIDAQPVDSPEKHVHSVNRHDFANERSSATDLSPRKRG